MSQKCDDDVCKLLLFVHPCSSVGLAKAALEAINGFNLFGNQVMTNMFFCSSVSRLVCGSPCTRQQRQSAASLWIFPMMFSLPSDCWKMNTMSWSSQLLHSCAVVVYTKIFFQPRSQLTFRWLIDFGSDNLYLDLFSFQQLVCS